MGEVAFNNQIDLGLSGKQNGTSEVTMNGTSYLVRSKVTLDKTEGKVDWYLRIVDQLTPTTWPDDVFAGFLPPNDATYRGEGHLTYRIKVRDDAPAGVKITNAASIIFDYNDPIETDPAWWNQVAEDIAVSNLVKTAELAAGDKLYVYDDSAKRYATWELQSDKTWKPVKTVKMVSVCKVFG